MNSKSFYKKALQCYIEATLDILNHFKSNVMEVHHVGSTSVESLELPGDIDVLVLVKYKASMDELPKQMKDKGYKVVKRLSPYYAEEIVLHCSHDDFDVNFILMDYDSERKGDILHCRDFLRESEKHISYLKKIKQEYLNSEISVRKYEEKKSEFFSAIMNQVGDAEVV